MPIPTDTRTVRAVDVCAASLRNLGLTIPYQSLRVEHSITLPNQVTQYGVRTQRVNSKTERELEELRKQKERLQLGPGAMESIWNQYQVANQLVFALDPDRMPARAYAFYRPFHVTPYEEWGIYIYVDKLLEYNNIFYDLLGSRVDVFTPETLMYCVLFEMFHHEFFHHIVESTATTLELVSARVGEPKPIYRDYRTIRDEKEHHPCAPLEEALANAYGYNAFSFQARIKIGYKFILMRMYQKVLKQHFVLEPDGYRHAGEYVGRNYLQGAVELLGLLLPGDQLDLAELYPIAGRVMPRGHTAFAEKPEIPTYLVGDEASLKTFYALVPAPLETYTQLFWHKDTEELDKYFQNKQQEKRAQAKSQLPLFGA